MNDQQPYKYRISTGTDNFQKLLFNSDIFVDKSLMIQTLLEDSGEVILIARPRRWGKSLNMDMIKRFFEVEVDEQGSPLPIAQKLNVKLFQGGTVELGIKGQRILPPLKISKYTYAMAQQGNYPVISINFKDIKGSNYQEIEDGIKYQVTRLFVQHRYLKFYEKKYCSDKATKEKFNRYFTGEIGKQDLKDSLCLLSELLFKHFNQKVYLLIDEYDTPINSSYLKFGNKPEEFEQVLDLFRGLLGSGLKSNPYLEKGMITGILRLAKANLFSDLNNVREYTLLDKKFAPFYGFTQQEIDELLKKVAIQTDPERVKDWYNGYTFGGEIIYNPWSIMLCLANEGVIDQYWIDSGGTELVDKVLLSDDIQEDIQELLAGRGIIKKIHKQLTLEAIDHNRDLFYSLLVFAGYLNPKLSNDDPENPRYLLTIPNKEIRTLYVERIMNWLARKLNITTSDYDSFIALLVDGQLDQFGQLLQSYILNSTSYHDLSQEKDYHNLMGGLFAPLVSRYRIESNKEEGHGRYDHILTPLANGGQYAFIMEYKVSTVEDDLPSLSMAGLTQINAKQYDAKIKTYPYVQEIIKVCLAFCGKKVTLAYQIDKVANAL